MKEPQKTGVNRMSSSRLDENGLQAFANSVNLDIDQGRMFGASVLIARNGVVQYRKTFGSVGPGRPAASDDLYLMMSLTKSFTAALVLRAIDQGRFTFDTRVAEILPAFGAAGKQHVTIYNLLTHTGGAWGGLMPPPPAGPQDIGNLAKSVAAVAAQPLAFTPGSRVFYSPIAGFNVLGQLLVETDPAKRSFRDIARDELFEPLGMTDSSFGLSIENPRRVPVSFTERNATPAAAMIAQVFNGLDELSELPSGNAFGTIDDMFLFTEALRLRGNNGSYRLISPSTFDYACGNHTGAMANGVWDFYCAQHSLPQFPANFSLLGGYVRGEGHYLSGAGQTASPRAFCALGMGSTMWMIDPVKDMTLIFLSAGLIEGLAHLQRLQRLSDIALAACLD